MTKVLKSKYKASRRLGVSIWGDAKDPFHKKAHRPGQHGLTGQVKVSDFGMHQKSKQRLKVHYGRIREKQFHSTFKAAAKMKGNTAENFVGLLERRLDAVVYRMNFAPTIFAARQLVSHGHIRVNGKKMDVASAKVKDGDIIEVAEATRQVPMVMEALDKLERRVPDYLEVDQKNFSGKFIRVPMVADVPYPFEADLNHIVEYYSH